MSNPTESAKCRARDDDTHWWIAYARHSAVDGATASHETTVSKAAAIVAAARVQPINASETRQPLRADKVAPRRVTRP